MKKPSSLPHSVSPHEYERSQYTTKNETIPVSNQVWKLRSLIADQNDFVLTHYPIVKETRTG